MSKVIHLKRFKSQVDFNFPPIDAKTHTTLPLAAFNYIYIITGKVYVDNMNGDSYEQVGVTPEFIELNNKIFKQTD